IDAKRARRDRDCGSRLDLAMEGSRGRTRHRHESVARSGHERRIGSIASESPRSAVLVAIAGPDLAELCQFGNGPGRWSPVGVISPWPAPGLITRRARRSFRVPYG